MIIIITIIIIFLFNIHNSSQYSSIHMQICSNFTFLCCLSFILSQARVTIMDQITINITMLTCCTIEFLHDPVWQCTFNDWSWGVRLVGLFPFNQLIWSSNLNRYEERFEFLSTWKTKNWTVFSSWDEASSTIWPTKLHGEIRGKILC